MGLRKCPRCELNYIRDDEQYCSVCRRSMKGEAETEDTIVMCTECGENPAVKGSELCAICLREVRRQESLEKLADSRKKGEAVDELGDAEMNELEVEVPIDNDIPEMELKEIDKELGEDMDDQEDEEDETLGMSQEEREEPDQEE